MIRYVEANPSDYREALASLTEAHYEDDHRKAVAPLDVDWALYDTLYENDVLANVAAYDGDELVGYINAIITPTPHNKDRTIAAMDALFVKESHRGQGIAKGLLSELETLVKTFGASWLHASFRSDKTAEGVLGSLDYRKEQVTYIKSLGDNL